MSNLQEIQDCFTVNICNAKLSDCTPHRELSMKKIMAIASGLLGLASFIEPSFAMLNGIYAGLGAGYGRLYTPNKNIFIVGAGGQHSQTLGGFGGRAFVGLNFNNYIALEGGYAAYPYSNYSGSTANGRSASLRYSAQAVDIVIKGYFPIPALYINPYIIIGAARYLGTTKFSDGTIPLTIAVPNEGTTLNRKIRPIYGLGVGGYISCHVFISAEYTRIQSWNSFNSNPNSIPYANLGTVNIGYHFG